MKRHFSEEDMWPINIGRGEKVFNIIGYAIREYQLKPQGNACITSIRMAKIKHMTTPNFSEERNWITHTFAGGNVKWHSHTRITVGQFLEKLNILLYEPSIVLLCIYPSKVKTQKPDCL